MTNDREDAIAALPARLISRRKALGISQAEAAARTHVTVRTWQRWETGATRAHFGHLPAMAAALETTPEELLGAEAGSDAPRALEDLRLEARLASIEAKLDEILTALRSPRPLTVEDAQRLLDESDALLQQEGVASETPRARSQRRSR